MNILLISFQYVCHCHHFAFLIKVYNKQRLFSVSEHQGGAGVGAGGAEQHQEGQVHAAGQSG